ncbi:MAG TPA: 4Fe-4S binding protein [Firmicutes bacterium]|jgi:pyruvate ferredoxin oxidoreductase gamma subunit|nr:4Fe-4S binding protein [Bacillota bacterium]
MDNIKLPVVNPEGFYEIRFESIGGLGANVAGKILAESGVLGMGLNGSNFSSYGSEKKGSSVKAFVRFCAPEVKVRSCAPVERPHLLAIFHEALIKPGSDVTGGLYKDSIIIVNTAKSVAEITEKLGITAGVVGVVDALSIAVQEKSRVNTAMLGAVARACTFLDADVIRDTIANTLGKKYPQLLEANLRCFQRGYDELRLETISDSDAAEQPFTRTQPVYGYETAPIGGYIPNPGNSVLKDLSISRQGFLPQYLREKCIDCAQCDLVCPDMCFVWEAGTDKRGKPAQVLRGIDYQYCKGCLKCVEACPVQALVPMRETDGYAHEHRVRHSLAKMADEQASQSA